VAGAAVGVGVTPHADRISDNSTNSVIMLYNLRMRILLLRETWVAKIGCDQLETAESVVPKDHLLSWRNYACLKVAKRVVARIR
jgi:hypothetical protein